MGGGVYRIAVTCLDVCIIDGISCDCMMNSSSSYAIYYTYRVSNQSNTHVYAYKRGDNIVLYILGLWLHLYMSNKRI